jgi:hypothetical protein
MASQKKDTSASTFRRSIVNWISLVEEASTSAQRCEIFQASIPDLLHDLRVLLVLMSTTNIMKIASEEPRLARFLASICPIPEFTAHIHLSRMLVKCILYLALGPRDDQHLAPSVRLKRRAAALQWALEQLEVLRRDVIQSEHYFMTIPTSTPRPQVNMMTDLGFSRTVLSSSVISTLISTLMLKLEHIDTMVASKPALLGLWSEEKSSKFSASKYCSVRHAISLKCSILLDNGPAVRPLIEKLISSTTRLQIPNSSSSTHQISPQAPSGTNSTPECFCGLANALVDSLFANGAHHFENLTLATRAYLLYQCPHAMSLEITRVLKSVVHRPLASRSTIQGLAGNIIEASFVFPAVYLHCASILRQLIISSAHPSIIRLYSIIAQSVHQRLESAVNLKSLSLAQYWPSYLVCLLENDPISHHQYKALTKELELVTGTRIRCIDEESSTLASQQIFSQEPWFLVLAFDRWIRQAYILGATDLRDTATKDDVFAFLAWHAHPVSDQHRQNAYNALKKLVPSIMSMYNGGTEVIEEVVLAPAVVHPFLLYCWNPALQSSTYYIERVLLHCMRNKTSITLCMILDFFEHLKAHHSQLVTPSLSTVLDVIQSELKSHPTVTSNADLKARIASLIFDPQSDEPQLGSQ